MIMPIVVDLPAPLPPSNAVTEPAATENVRPSTADCALVDLAHTGQERWRRPPARQRCRVRCPGTACHGVHGPDGVQRDWCGDHVVPDRHYLELGRPARRVRLATLVGLRWLAIGGQSVAVLGVHFLLGFPLPLGWLPARHRGVGPSSTSCCGCAIRTCTGSMTIRPRFCSASTSCSSRSLLFLTGGLNEPLLDAVPRAA